MGLKDYKPGGINMKRIFIKADFWSDAWSDLRDCVRVVAVIAIFLVVTFPPLGARAMARDYMVDFVSENYREGVADHGNAPRVFHTIQVNSSLGSRLLILTGDDFQYRDWLRSYLRQNKRLIVRVPDMEDDAFRVSKAHGIDVTLIYPVDQEKWQAPEVGAVPVPAFTGEPHVLIVDANEKRRGLIDLIVRNLGYPVTVAANGTDALFMFRSKPGKFRMVITDSTLPGISGAQLVKNLIYTAPDLPVILGTSYGDKNMEKNAEASFAGADSVVIKPVVLKELPKTIRALLKEQV
jgi:CheY-like chemotaxis protein